MSYPVRLEEVLDKIATELIQSEFVNPSVVTSNQKTIVDGVISIGRENSDKLLLFEKDIKANEEDLENVSGALGTTTLSQIVENIGEQLFEIEITAGPTITLYSDSTYVSGIDITSLLITGENNPLNVSQFLTLPSTGSLINAEQAEEFFDLNISELLPSTETREQRINRWFVEFDALTQSVPYTYSSWPDLNNDGLADEATDYDSQWDVSQNPANISASITRLDSNAPANNSGNTLENLRNRLNLYLKDVDDEEQLPSDQRPEYENKSSGYLKFRQLNQGIIIRNVDSNYVEGLNPDTQEYLTTGFTITMWVRFLDRVSEGTLFNFGNPTRETNPLGFKLDTLIHDERRFLRLVVYDGQGISGTNPYAGVGHWYDSHMGMSGNDSILNFTLEKKDTTTLTGLDLISPFQYTNVPVDFTEWYFICATYNPSINEQYSNTRGYDLLEPDYWRNNMVDNSSSSPTEYTHDSGFGNRSKVEIISRSDLLRARGYRV